MSSDRPAVLVRVMYAASPGWWRVVVGPGVGMLGGGAHNDMRDEDIPPAARRPNGEFWMSGWEDGRPVVVDPTHR